MRRIVVALFVLVLAFSLVGCGGGEEAAAPEAGAPAPDPLAAPPAAEVVDDGDFSDPASAVTFEPFPPGLVLPEELAADIGAKQPTLILFIDGSQEVTNEVRTAVDTAVKANRGVVTLHAYDLGRFTKVDASGTVLVDVVGLEKNTDLGRAAGLARGLGVKTLPYIVMTDDQGFIVSRRQGLVDAEFLQMHMERLTD